MDDIPDVIARGGGRFAGALAGADLIDEYRLLVQPLVLGRGRSGTVVHIYRPQHD